MDTLSVLHLPNEVLLHVLHPLPTPDLLPLTAVNHRFYNLIIRILHVRFILAASLPGRSLVFECYPPSRRLYESYMLAEFLGTDGLDDAIARSTSQSPGETLAEFNNLYTRFRPYRKTTEKKVQWKHPAGDIPGTRTYGNNAYYGNNSTVRTFSPAAAYAGPYVGQPVGSSSEEDQRPTGGVAQTLEVADRSHSPQEDQHSQWFPQRQRQAQPQSGEEPAVEHPAQASSSAPQPTSSNPPAAPNADYPEVEKEEISTEVIHESITTQVHLDDSENLQQLCANVAIFIPGPKPGIFRGFQDVLKDGVLRIWRHWLQEREAERKRSEAVDEGVEAGVQSTSGKGKERATDKRSANLRQVPNILWVGHGSKVGVRFSVKQKKWNRPGPILMRADEDGPVSFEVIYEELLVRTWDLLLASERLDDQKTSDTGKAVVFGTWAS